jgi:hypothetical protein
MYSSTDLQPQVMVDSAGDVSEPYGSWIRAKRMAVPIVVSGRTFTIRHLPGCTAVNLAALIGNSVYVAEQQSGTVFSVLPGRAQRSIFKLAGRTIDAEFARVWRTPPGGPPGSQRVADDILASFGKLGDPFPYSWDMLLADPTGSLWLRRVECGPPVRERLWDVVDTAGGLRAQLRTDAQLLAVNGRHALVVAGDSVTVSLRVIEGR